MLLPTESQSQTFKPAAAKPMAPGDIIPALRFDGPNGKAVALNADDVAGNYIVLLLCPGLTGGTAADLLQSFEEVADRLKASGTLIFGVMAPSHKDNAAVAASLGLSFPILSDPENRTLMLFKAEEPIAVLIRPNQHVMGCFPANGGNPTDAVLMALATDADNRQATVTSRHPPVLMVPDVLSRKDCEELMGVYALQGNIFVEPGHGSKNMQSDYKMRIPDYGRKDRIDHWVINNATTQFVYDRLSSRLFPEIEKAFQYRVTRFERFRIGCYHGERGGEIHGHRDNSQPAAAYRRFACSINLNTDQFEGGELRFPEYGGHLYRPETGTAIAFSSSLLHEPLHVTTGTRYVLLAFLYGET